MYVMHQRLHMFTTSFMKPHIIMNYRISMDDYDNYKNFVFSQFILSKIKIEIPHVIKMA